MGSAREVAEEITTALENHDLDRARSLMADNFTFHDPDSPRGEMSVDEWLGATRSMHQAFPDLSYNFEIEREEGNQVWVSASLEGTHTGDWDLSPMGIGVIPATGRKVSTARGTTRGTINDDGNIERIEVVDQDEDGGVMGVMKQVGIDMG